MSPRRRIHKKKAGDKFGIKKQKKLVVLFAIILLAFVGLSIRLVWIYQKDGEKYKKQILSQQEYDSKTLPYKRGEILDANETKLAYSEKVYNLVVDARVINSSKAENAMETTVSALGRYFGVDTAAMRDHITTNKENQYYVVLKALEYDKVAPFLEEQQKNKSIVGVWFEEEYKRKYPYSTLASSVIGFTGSDNNGTFGLEEYYNSTLNGTNGREYGYLTEDSTLERTTIAAQNGHTVVTSLDVNIQNVVEKYIQQFNEAHRGEFRSGEDGSTNTGVESKRLMDNPIPLPQEQQDSLSAIRQSTTEVRSNVGYLHSEINERLARLEAETEQRKLEKMLKEIEAKEAKLKKMDK